MVTQDHQLDPTTNKTTNCFPSSLHESIKKNKTELLAASVLADLKEQMLACVCVCVCVWQQCGGV